MVSISFLRSLSQNGLNPVDLHLYVYPVILHLYIVTVFFLPFRFTFLVPTFYNKVGTMPLVSRIRAFVVFGKLVIILVFKAYNPNNLSFAFFADYKLTQHKL